MFLPLFSLFVVGFYSNRLTTVAVVQLLVQTWFRTACLTVLAKRFLHAKLKWKIYFHCNYSKIFWYNNVFCRCFSFLSSDFTQTVLRRLRWCNYLYKHPFAFSVVGFYSNRLTTVAVVQLLVQTWLRTGVFGGFPLYIAFYDKKDIFRQNLPLTCAWRDVQLQRQVPCTAKSQPFCTVYFLFCGTVEVFVRLR